MRKVNFASEEFKHVELLYIVFLTKDMRKRRASITDKLSVYKVHLQFSISQDVRKIMIIAKQVERIIKGLVISLFF